MWFMIACLIGLVDKRKGKRCVAMEQLTGNLLNIALIEAMMELKANFIQIILGIMGQEAKVLPFHLVRICRSNKWRPPFSLGLVTSGLLQQQGLFLKYCARW